MNPTTLVVAFAFSVTLSTQVHAGAGLPECNVSVVCTASGEGIFYFEGASGELYLNGKVVPVTLASEKVLNKPHPEFIIEGHSIERHWRGASLEIVEITRVTEQTCYFENPSSKAYEEAQTGCGTTEDVTLIITSHGKTSTIQGSRYVGA